MDKRLAKIVAKDMLISKKAGRWGENKNFKGALEDLFSNNREFIKNIEDVAAIDEFMLLLQEEKDKLPSRLQKFVNSYCDYIGNGNIYQNSLGAYFDYMFPDGDVVGNLVYVPAKTDIIEFLKENNSRFSDIANVVSNIINMVSNIEVEDDIEKAQKEKILRTIKVKGNKLIKSCNDFKMLVETELLSSNVESADLPFIYVVNLKTKKPLKHDGTEARKIEEVAKFKNDDDAMELVDKGGIDFASVDCKNENDYRKLLDSLRR